MPMSMFVCCSINPFTSFKSCQIIIFISTGFQVKFISIFPEFSVFQKCEMQYLINIVPHFDVHFFAKCIVSPKTCKFQIIMIGNAKL